MLNLMDRLEAIGGADQVDRMIDEKQWSFSMAKNSHYHSKWLIKIDGVKQVDDWFRGILNPSKLDEDKDNKIISADKEAKLKNGQLFYCKENEEYWLIYLHDTEESAYFRGHCRRCNKVVRWVDGDRQLHETRVAIIGPQSVPLLNQLTGRIATNLPQGYIEMLVPDNYLNRKYFNRDNKFIVDGDTFKIETVDTISNPGIIQCTCTEDYSNRITDDIEESISNAYNVLETVKKDENGDFISGEQIVKPLKWYDYELKGTHWNRNNIVYWSVLNFQGRVVPVEEKYYPENPLKISLRYKTLEDYKFILTAHFSDNSRKQLDITVKNIF